MPPKQRHFFSTSSTRFDTEDEDEDTDRNKTASTEEVPEKSIVQQLKEQPRRSKLLQNWCRYARKLVEELEKRNPHSTFVTMLQERVANCFRSAEHAHTLITQWQKYLNGSVARSIRMFEVSMAFQHFQGKHPETQEFIDQHFLVSSEETTPDTLLNLNTLQRAEIELIGEMCMLASLYCEIPGKALEFLLPIIESQTSQAQTGGTINVEQVFALVPQISEALSFQELQGFLLSLPRIFEQLSAQDYEEMNQVTNIDTSLLTQAVSILGSTDKIDEATLTKAMSLTPGSGDALQSLFSQQ